MKLLKKLFFAILLIIIIACGYLYIKFNTIEVENIADGLYLLRGEGSNTTVLKTSSGTVVIDSMSFPMQGNIINKMAEQLTGQPVVLLINTHYHFDHTHGNPGFQPDIRVVSTERTLSHMKKLDVMQDFWDGDNSQFLPSETFSDQLNITIGDHTLTLKHPGLGHTNGDLVVLINNHKTVVMGDLFFNHYYPNIDLEAGGSVQQWPLTIENVLSLNFDTVIPGHGETSDRAGLEQFQAFMHQLGTIAVDAAAANQSLESTLNTNQLTKDHNYSEFALAGIPIGLNREFVLRRAWEEVTDNFTLKSPDHHH